MTIDEQIEAKWKELGDYRDAPFSEADIERMTQIVLEVQELNAVKIILSMVRIV